LNFFSNHGYITVQEYRNFVSRTSIPHPEDIFALFRKHDRLCHGRLGFPQFTYALTSHILTLDGSYPSDTLPIGSPVSPKGKKPSGKHKHEWMNLDEYIKPTTTRLTLEQENLLLTLFYTEMSMENNFNFLCVQLNEIPFFDLMNCFNYVDRNKGNIENKSYIYFTCNYLIVFVYFQFCCFFVDGVISLEEFEKIFHKFDIHPRIRELKYLIYRMDKDHDARINYFEWVK
jgi:Ca2+-binding EF-hand superfamily protein